MKILKDYFEPERILTYVDACTISENERKELRKLANLERKELLSEYKQLMTTTELPKDTTSNYYITRRLLGKRIYSTKYSDKSPLRKEIIYAYAILPNDEEVEGLLTKNGYTYEHLQEVMRVRKYFLDIIKYQYPNVPNELLKEQINTYKNYVTTIINLFNQEFGINNATIILNRICELLATRPTYFKPKSHNK